MKNGFYVGAARVSITPGDDFFPVTTFENLKYRGVYRNIYIRAIAMKNAEKTIVILSYELLAVPHYRVTRARIAEALNIPAENIFLTATHNHSVLALTDDDKLIDTGLPMDPQVASFEQMIEDNGVRAAVQAVDNLRPATLGIGKGYSYINVNRDQHYPDGEDEGADFSRPSDKELYVLRFDGTDGTPIAVMTNYACHPNCEVLAGCEVDNAKMSGDLSGATSAVLEKKYGDNFVALWTNGAEGNQNPVMKNYIPKYNPDGSHGWDKIGTPVRACNEYLAHQHAYDIIYVYENIDYRTDDVSLSLAKRAIQIEGMKPNPETMGTLPNGKWEMMDSDPLEVRLQLLRINDTVMYFISGEPVTEVGMAIKVHSPLKNTMVVGISDGHSGYFPDDYGYKHHTFEYYLSHAKQCAEPVFLQCFDEMLRELQ